MMLKLVIRMELDTAAFEDAGVDEVTRLLESVAARIPDPLAPTNGGLSLHDSNGNWVGEAVIMRTRDR